MDRSLVILPRADLPLSHPLQRTCVWFFSAVPPQTLKLQFWFDPPLLLLPTGTLRLAQLNGLCQEHHHAAFSCVCHACPASRHVLISARRACGGDGCRARWAVVRVGARPRHLPHRFSATQGAEPPSACLVNCWMINANALSAIVSPPKARATSAR